MKKVIYINSITQLLDSYNLSKPKHPLIAVVDLSKIQVTADMLGIKISSDMYCVTMKTKSPGRVKYGRSVIDFEEGSLYGCAPGQVLEVDEAAAIGEFEGWALYFHPDLIRGHELEGKFMNYRFFDYETDEALHVSEREKDTLTSIIRKIEQEYQANIDEYSRDVLVANIELLLNYIKRYYSRQFLTRKSKHSDLLTRFEQLLKSRLNADNLEGTGLPNVQSLADSLSLSPSYLSDLLKKETGKNTQEHIHYHLIEKAKYLLLNSQRPVADIAYGLGFEHPPYFSRLFKKKTGVSPTQFRISIN